MIRSTTKKLVEKIPKPIAHALSPWAKIPGAPTVLRTVVTFLPIPFIAKPVLKGYIDGVSAPQAASLAKGVTSAAA